MRQRLLAGLTAAYLILLVDLTLVRFPQRDPTPNLIPLRTIASCLEDGGRSIAVNLFGNLALLAPLGPLLRVARRGRIGPVGVMIAGALLSTTIEAAQFTSGRRMADIDDVLLNSAGALLGYTAFSAVDRRPAEWSSIRIWPRSRTRLMATGRMPISPDTACRLGLEDGKRERRNTSIDRPSHLQGRPASMKQQSSTRSSIG